MIVRQLADCPIVGGNVGSESGKRDEVIYGSISLDSIRLIFQPASRYYVSWNTYPAGTTFSGWGRVGRRYIISSSCKIRVAGHSWDLSSGDFLDVPEGGDQFAVPKGSLVKLGSVWELPEAFWQSPEDM